jgi:hypothetical protein
MYVAAFCPRFSLLVYYSHSSSAIFEREIEHISCSPLHRTARSKQTEQLDQSIPCVLNNAADILASSPSALEDDRVSIVAHAPSAIAPAGTAAGSRRGNGFTSSTGSYGSRSPNPTMGKRTSLLLSLPNPSLLRPTRIPTLHVRICQSR